MTRQEQYRDGPYVLHQNLKLEVLILQTMANGRTLTTSILQQYRKTGQVDALQQYRKDRRNTPTTKNGRAVAQAHALQASPSHLKAGVYEQRERRKGGGQVRCKPVGANPNLLAHGKVRGTVLEQ